MSKTSPATPTRRELRRGRTLDRIAAAAFPLFEARGFDAVTMEEIAAAADVARGTLYNHFPVKEAVLAHWIHLQLARDLGALAAEVEAQRGFPARLGALLGASAAWCSSHRRYLPPYLRHRMTCAAPEREPAPAGTDLATAFRALIAAAQADGELRADRPAAQLAAFLHHLYLAALLRWLADERLALADEFAAAVECFLHGAARGDRGDRA